MDFQIQDTTANLHSVIYLKVEVKNHLLNVVCSICCRQVGVAREHGSYSCIRLDTSSWRTMWSCSKECTSQLSFTIEVLFFSRGHLPWLDPTAKGQDLSQLAATTHWLSSTMHFAVVAIHGVLHLKLWTISTLPPLLPHHPRYNPPPTKLSARARDDYKARETMDWGIHCAAKNEGRRSSDAGQNF